MFSVMDKLYDSGVLGIWEGWGSRLPRTRDSEYRKDSDLKILGRVYIYGTRSTYLLISLSFPILELHLWPLYFLLDRLLRVLFRTHEIESLSQEPIPTVYFMYIVNPVWILFLISNKYILRLNWPVRIKTNDLDS